MFNWFAGRIACRFQRVVTRNSFRIVVLEIGVGRPLPRHQLQRVVQLGVLVPILATCAAPRINAGKLTASAVLDQLHLVEQIDGSLRDDRLARAGNPALPWAQVDQLNSTVHGSGT